MSEMFTRKHLLASDWYQQRLATKQRRDIALWERNVVYLERFLSRTSHADVARRMDIAGRLQDARRALDDVSSPRYLENLRGTIGADPLGRSQSTEEDDAVGIAEAMAK
jgi:hypothetical protein